jgi:hypothetical protein
VQSFQNRQDCTGKDEKLRQINVPSDADSESSLFKVSRRVTRDVPVGKLAYEAETIISNGWARERRLTGIGVVFVGMTMFTTVLMGVCMGAMGMRCGRQMVKELNTHSLWLCQNRDHSFPYDHP